MALPYVPTNWLSGDIVSSARLNKLEGGVKENSDAIVENTSDINNLKSEIDDLNGSFSTGAPTLMVFDWTRGENWKSGNTINTAEIAYRVCNSAPFVYPAPLKILSCKTGFVYKLYIDSGKDGTYSTYIGWNSDGYIIPANTPTYISLKKTTEVTTETADISEFVGALTIQQFLVTETDFKEVKGIVYGGSYSEATADNTMAGKYIAKNGAIYNLDKYTVYCFDLDKNEILEVISTKGISDETAIAFISVWKDNAFLYEFGSATNGSPTQDIFIANESCEVRVTTRNNDTSYKYTFAKSSFSESLSNYVGKSILPTEQGQILTAFKNITCIGDSLTYSQVFTSENASRQAYKPYPKVLADRAGATPTILATAGDSASDSWGHVASSIEAKDAQLTLIYLGTNGGLTDTIDTDCAGDDYTQWADTNTGCYGKLIAKSLSVGSRVVLIKVHSGPSVTTTNSVIEKMATKFNVPFVENTYLGGTKYHSYPDGSGTNGTHYNDFGYSVFADQIAESISNLPPAEAVKIIPV